VVEDMTAGVDTTRIAARFHHGLAYAVVGACERVRELTGLDTVALSGGVFQNAMLLRLTLERLRAKGIQAITHRTVPPNDGGVALGQLMVGNSE